MKIIKIESFSNQTKEKLPSVLNIIQECGFIGKVIIDTNLLNVDIIKSLDLKIILDLGEGSILRYSGLEEKLSFLIKKDIFVRFGLSKIPSFLNPKKVHLYLDFDSFAEDPLDDFDSFLLPLQYNKHIFINAGDEKFIEKMREEMKTYDVSLITDVLVIDLINKSSKIKSYKLSKHYFKGGCLSIESMVCKLRDL